MLYSKVLLENADDVSVDEVVGVVSPHEVQMRVIWQMALEEHLRRRQFILEPVDVEPSGEPVALRPEEQCLHWEFGQIVVWRLTLRQHSIDQLLKNRTPVRAH